jgi:hypothetical protein
VAGRGAAWPSSIQRERNVLIGAGKKEKEALRRQREARQAAGLSRVACVPHGFIPVSALPMSQRCYRTMSYVSTAVRLTLL